MSKQFVDYRLGNIIDAWYGQHHVRSRGACSLHSMTINNPSTFGSYLVQNPPSSITQCVSDKFCNDASTFWWCYFYDNMKMVYPSFPESLRYAISQYFHDKKVDISPDTCVVHFRVGDFLLEQMMSIHNICNAVDMFKNTPNRFEIMDSGRRFRANDHLSRKSDEILSQLEQALKEKYPGCCVCHIESSNPDDDFFRMVCAPMLITGPGSFAMMAAAANTNERLTPALNNMNFPREGSCETSHVFEDWYTYPVVISRNA